MGATFMKLQDDENCVFHPNGKNWRIKDPL
jgi:hypothetical protein